MSEKTQVAFNVLHEKILGFQSDTSEQYRLGYMSGLRSMQRLLLKTVDELRNERRRYIDRHTPFAAGVARAIQEVIWSKMRQGGEAA